MDLHHIARRAAPAAGALGTSAVLVCGQDVVCPAGEAGAVTSGWTYTFSLYALLPLAVGNEYQGAGSRGTPGADAVQAGNNNPLAYGRPPLNDPSNRQAEPRSFRGPPANATLYYSNPNQPAQGWSPGPAPSCVEPLPFFRPST